MAYLVTPLKERYLKLRFSSKARLGLYEKISSFVEQGVDLHSCLGMLSKQFKKNNPSDYRVDILNEWSAAMETGKTFAEALQGWVPASESMLIKSGEKSGKPEAAMKSAIVVTTASGQMKSAVIGQMLYPVILAIVLFAIIYLMSTKALPVFAEILDVGMWPVSAQKLYNLGQFVVNFWPIMLGVIGAVGLAIGWTMPRVTGPVRILLDNIPPWSFYRVVQSSSFLIALGAMVRSGNPLTDSIEDIRDLSSPYVQYQIDKMLSRIVAGGDIGMAMNQGFLSKETGIDIEIYSELNNLKDVLELIGSNDIKEGIKLITVIASALKYLAMGAVAGYIMWLISSMQLIQGAINASMGA